MVSSLVAAPANFFVGFQEVKLFRIIKFPLFYKRYVDDTLVIFSSKSESRLFFNSVNQLLPASTFTNECKYKYSKCLSFRTPKMRARLLACRRQSTVNLRLLNHAHRWP